MTVDVYIPVFNSITVASQISSFSKAGSSTINVHLSARYYSIPLANFYYVVSIFTCTGIDTQIFNYYHSCHIHIYWKNEN